MQPPIRIGKGGAPAIGRDLRRVRWEIVLLGVAVAVGMALRLVPVHAGFWYDEVFTAWATDPALSLRTLWPRIFADTQPPGYYPLMWAWHRLVGNDPASSRLLGGALGALALPAVWALQARALRPLQLLAGTGAVALAWFGIYYAHEARSYAFLYALSAVGYALVTRSLVVGRTRCATVALLATALVAGLVHYYGMVLGCALFIARAAGQWQRGARAAARADLGWCAALAAMFALLLLAQGEHLAAVAPGFHKNSRGLLARLDWYWHLMVHTRWGTLGFAALVLAAARPRALGRALPYGLGIAASVVAPVLVSVHTPILGARYFIIIAPPLLLGLGELAGAPDAGRVREALILAALLGIGTGSVSGWFTLDKTGWRESAALVDATHQPQCPLPVYVDRFDAGAYGYFLTPAQRAALVAVPPQGPLPTLSARCRVRLWVGEDFDRRTVQPPPGTRVVEIGDSAVWLAPAPAGH